MPDVSRGAEVLARLKPTPKHRSKNREPIEALRGAIYEAKDRGNTWKQIAEGLAEVGITVSPAALRFAINAEKRDFKKYPKRKRSPAASSAGTNDATGESSSVTSNDSPAETSGDHVQEALAHLKTDPHLDMTGAL